MNHPNSILKFSLDLNSLSFDVDSQHIHLEQGLGFINSKSISNGVIDELVIEKMIYFIEEIIESQPLRNLNINGIAVTADTAMAQLSKLFFSAKKQISRIELEHIRRADTASSEQQHVGRHVATVGEIGDDMAAVREPDRRHLGAKP